MIKIKDLLDDPSKLNAETLPELKAIVETYPFFQVARLLYLSNLYKLHSQDFGAELRRASVYVPDRTALFALTEGINYELPTQGNGIDIVVNDEGDRTISLINTFLTQGHIETDDEDMEERNEPSVADLTNDYASYLMQQDKRHAENQETQETPKLKGGELIDTFIEENKGKQRVEIQHRDDEDFVSPELSVEDEEIYTESMVNIYIKQKRYQQALEILRKICLNNPKKSANFATEISLLEIILNEKK